MGKNTKTIRSTFYKANYNFIVKNRIPVKGYKYDTYVEEVITDGSQYKQCYDSNGNKAQRELPKYWFISKEGFLINVEHKNNPKFVHPSIESHRPCFKISRGTTKDKAKYISTYGLVTLVYADQMKALGKNLDVISENAKSILNQYGIDAFGRNKENPESGEKNIKVHPHHMDGYSDLKDIKTYVKNNNPERIQIISNTEHEMLKAGKGSDIETVKAINKTSDNWQEMDKVFAIDFEGNKILDNNLWQVVHLEAMYIGFPNSDKVIPIKVSK